MKTFHSILALAAASLLAGCGDKAPSPNTADTAKNATAPAAADYGGALVNAKKSADKTIDVASLNQALQMFNVQEGHYPKTLQELVPAYIAKLPAAPLGYQLNYDAAKGEVKAVKP